LPLSAAEFGVSGSTAAVTTAPLLGLRGVLRRDVMEFLP
jgi:hypothetical protein